MAGLNSLVADSTTQSTALPSWYNTAQQNLTSQAQAAAAQTPAIQNTAGGQFASQLMGANNPFAQGQTTLNQIATGAANPWITDASGNVTPNTNTALGGLFASQNAQLEKTLPNVTAPIEGANIAGGQFGSLRGQTAVDKAKGDALANLFAQQNQAALSAQQTGAQAAANLGTLGSQQGQTSIAAGQYQQNAPLAGLTNLANIINAEKTGTDVTKSVQYSPLSQATGLLTALGGSTGNAGVLGQLFGSTVTDPVTGKTTVNKGLLGSGGLSGLFSGSGTGGTLKSAFTSLFGTNSGVQADANGNPIPGTYDGAGGEKITINGSGGISIRQPDGTVQNFNEKGELYSAPTDSGNPLPDIGGGSTPTNPDGTPDLSGGGWGTGGGYVDPGLPAGVDTGGSGDTTEGP